MREELDKYLSTGNYLGKDITNMGDSIRNAMESTRSPKLFYFLEASSGMGKSQLASSLSVPVVYIPSAKYQLIYECFSSVYEASQSALIDDTLKHLDFMKSVLKYPFELHYAKEEFRTVGLLVALFKEVHGKTNEESLKILSGYYGKRKIKYKPMSVHEAEMVLNNLMTADNIIKDMVPIFFIDEIPSDVKNDDLTFLRYLFLRNVIRNMNCICIISGTEPSFLNAIDKLRLSSRTDGVYNEYSRLILKLPTTNWDAICHESKYAELIPLLSSDVRDMLLLTRPLFVQYLLDAMLEERSMGQLTAAVLSNAKSKVVDNKKKFSTIEGLYGQMALLHSKFISYTIDDLLYTYSHGVMSDTKAVKDSKNYIVSQRQSCITHHFGNLRVLNSDDPILSMYLDNHIYTLNKNGRSGERVFIKRDVFFETPYNDPLLFLICIRNGLYYADSDENPHRISSTFALSLLLNERLGRNTSLFESTMQSSSFAKFLEIETVSAAIIASHSYPNSLSGCPLDFFLRSIIAELNPFKDYVTFDAIKGIPTVFREVQVGLLSPANLSWRENKESVLMLQDSSIALGSCIWNCSISRNDGILPLFMGASKVFMGSLETKCFKEKVRANELIKTINDTILNDNLITIMNVSNFGTIHSSNLNFKKASLGINVFKIEGNADEKNLVATNLRLKRLDRNQDSNVADMPKHTVIMINLNSIYYDRYKYMKFPLA